MKYPPDVGAVVSIVLTTVTTGPEVDAGTVIVAPDGRARGKSARKLRKIAKETYKEWK